MNGTAPIYDHQQIIHEHREGESELLLLRKELLGNLVSHRLDAADVNDLLVPAEIMHDDFLSVLRLPTFVP